MSSKVLEDEPAMAFASYAHTRALTIDDGTHAVKGRVNDTDVVAGHLLSHALLILVHMTKMYLIVNYLLLQNMVKRRKVLAPTRRAELKVPFIKTISYKKHKILIIQLMQLK